MPRATSRDFQSALWLTSHGAPPDYRKLTGPGWAWGSPGWFSVLPEDITSKLWPGGSAMSRRTSAISDPSSVDSLNPSGSQVSKHPTGMVALSTARNYLRFLPAVLPGDPRG